MRELPRNRMARVRPCQSKDSCEICDCWDYAITAVNGRHKIVLCFECSREQRRLTDIWDKMKGKR